MSSWPAALPTARRASRTWPHTQLPPRRRRQHASPSTAPQRRRRRGGPRERPSSRRFGSYGCSKQCGILQPFIHSHTHRRRPRPRDEEHPTSHTQKPQREELTKATPAMPKAKKDATADVYESVTDGLKQLYRQKIRPVEEVRARSPSTLARASSIFRHHDPVPQCESMAHPTPSVAQRRPTSLVSSSRRF